MRELLRDYVLIMANTGMRHGTEAQNLKWQHITQFEGNGQSYLEMSVSGKTGRRDIICRSGTINYLKRIHECSEDIKHLEFEGLLKQRLDLPVFRLRDGTVTNALHQTFRNFLKENELLICRIGRRDVVYVNLQYQPNRDQIEQARQAGFQILDIPEIDNFSDIEGLAALIKATDQLVTIDNMAVHLAGALGTATQLWLPSVPEWRWGNAKEPCRWYRSVELKMMDCCAPYFWNPLAQDLHPLRQRKG